MSEDIPEPIPKLFLDRDPDDPAPVEELTTPFHDRFGGWRMLAVHHIWETSSGSEGTATPPGSSG